MRAGLWSADARPGAVVGYRGARWQVLAKHPRSGWVWLLGADQAMLGVPLAELTPAPDVRERVS